MNTVARTNATHDAAGCGPDVANPKNGTSMAHQDHRVEGRDRTGRVIA